MSRPVCVLCSAISVVISMLAPANSTKDAAICVTAKIRWRRLVLPKKIENWSLTSLQQRLVKTGGRLIKHARYYWLLLAESHLTRRLFGSMLQRIWALSVFSKSPRRLAACCDLAISADHVIETFGTATEENQVSSLREHQVDTIVNFAAETHVDRSIADSRVTGTTIVPRRASAKRRQLTRQRLRSRRLT